MQADTCLGLDNGVGYFCVIIRNNSYLKTFILSQALQNKIDK